MFTSFISSAKKEAMKRIIYSIMRINLIVGLFCHIAALVSYFLLSEADKLYAYKRYCTSEALGMPIMYSVVGSSLIIFVYLLVNRLLKKMQKEDLFIVLGIGMISTLLVNLVLWGAVALILPLIKP